MCRGDMGALEFYQVSTISLLLCVGASGLGGIVYGRLIGLLHHTRSGNTCRFLYIIAESCLPNSFCLRAVEPILYKGEHSVQRVWGRFL
jgi:hypothetical protein